MKEIELVKDSDEPLVFEQLSNGVPIDGSIIVKAVVQSGGVTIDSSENPSDLRWTNDGVFTINFRGQLPYGSNYITLRLFYADSVHGTVVVHKEFENSSILIKAI